MTEFWKKCLLNSSTSKFLVHKIRFFFSSTTHTDPCISIYLFVQAFSITVYLYFFATQTLA
jgi:hypothetical protein